MNLLEKIEAALDSATPPVADLLRECEAYVRAAGECEELLLLLTWRDTTKESKKSNVNGNSGEVVL